MSEERQTEISIDSKHLHVFLGGFVKCAMIFTTTMAQNGCSISYLQNVFHRPITIWFSAEGENQTKDNDKYCKHCRSQ